MPNGQSVQKVQLGCGTLILIALIVLIFSGHDSGNVGGLRSDVRDLQADVRRLSSDVAELKQVVKAQTEQIESLRKKLDSAPQK